MITYILKKFYINKEMFNLADNILKAKISVQGTRTLLWNRFNVELLDVETKKSGVKGNDCEEWKKSVLFTKNRQLYVMPEAIFSCIRDGAKYTRNGRSTMQNVVAATLQVVDTIVLVDRFLPYDITKDPSNDVYLDVRSVKNHSSRARNIRYRVAAKDGWKISFNITWDCTLLSEELLKAIIIDAGNYCGLGDGRTIGMGRFKLEKFQVIEDDKNAEKETA